MQRGWPGPGRSALVLLILATAGLAGCLGTSDEPPGALAEPEDPFAGAVLSLPRVTLEGATEGHRATIRITLDGDADAVSAYIFDAGDGTTPRHDDTAPPERILHEYPPIAHDAAPRIYRATLTLVNPVGESEDTTLQLTITPAAPDLPTPILQALTYSTGAVPHLVTFHLNHTDPQGLLRGWRFDPGDGSARLQGTGAPPAELRHEYRTIGTHSAQLTLTAVTSGTTHTRLDVNVQPPADLAVWSLSSATGNLTGTRGDGTPLHARGIPPEECGTPTTCPQPIALGADRGILAVAYRAPGGSGLLRLIDAATGIELRSLPLQPAPDRIHKDPTGGLWITHTQGHISRIDTTALQVHPYALRLADDATLQPVWDRGVTRAWILVADAPTRIIRLDIATGAQSVSLLPDIAEARHIARSDRHATIHIATADGNVHTLIEVADHLVPIATRGPDQGIAGTANLATPLATRTPSALICPGASDHCWASYLGTDGAPALLVKIPARSPTAGIPLPEATPRIPLDAGITPLALHAHQDGVVVATHHATEGRGALLVDGDGQTRPVPMPSRMTNNTTAPSEPAPPILATLPQHAGLLYHAEPGSDAWRILDLHAARWVHQTTVPAAAQHFAVGTLRR